MAKGLSVVSGSTSIHTILNDGNVSFSGSVAVTGSLVPEGDGSRTFGTNDNRWADVYAIQTTVGAVFEYGLTTDGIGKYPTGTVLVWKNGKCVPCSKKEDNCVVGVVKETKDQPIILGAEPVLVTGVVKEGDYIVSSDVVGHGCAAKQTNIIGLKRSLHGKIIAQALENADGPSSLIKCFIKKL